MAWSGKDQGSRHGLAHDSVSVVLSGQITIGLVDIDQHAQDRDGQLPEMDDGVGKEEKHPPREDEADTT